MQRGASIAQLGTLTDCVQPGQSTREASPPPRTPRSTGTRRLVDRRAADSDKRTHSQSRPAAAGAPRLVDPAASRPPSTSDAGSCDASNTAQSSRCGTPRPPTMESPKLGGKRGTSLAYCTHEQWIEFGWNQHHRWSLAMDEVQGSIESSATTILLFRATRCQDHFERSIEPSIRPIFS